MGIGQLRNSTLTLLRGDWQYVARWQASWELCGKYNILHCKGALKCGMFCAVCSVHIIQCILCVLYIIQCILCAVCIARCGCFVGSLSWLRFDHPVTPVTWLRVAAVTKIPNHPPPILSTSPTKTEVIGLPGCSWVGSGGLTHAT